MTKRYGILAYPAKHSLSPAVHNAVFKFLGIDASFEYFEISELKFDEFMSSLDKEGISGLAVSLPYKEAVMKYLDEVDSSAKEIGAVNTVINKNGKLYGYNTDYVGVIKALEEKTEVNGKRCIVVGAGGAARAVIYALLKEGASVGIYNRTQPKAKEMAKEFEKFFGVKVGYGDLRETPDGEILVNTTSIWLGKGAKLEDLMPEESLHGFKVVMDIVYKPLITPLLQAAQDKGMQIITGDKMFLYQAFEQFELWTGEKPPAEIMWKAFEEKLSGKA